VCQFVEGHLKLVLRVIASDREQQAGCHVARFN
jgi:hypothetical protein